MKLLITLTDIAAFTAFSTNIGAHLVTPYIREAQTFDVKLPVLVRAELEAELPTINPLFKPEEFEAVNFPQEAVAAGWANPKLARAWYEAIRPLLALEAARRMLLWHGLHITPAGCENGSALPITDGQRAALRADLQAKAMHYRALYEAALHTLAPITSPAGCAPTRRRPSNGGLRSAAL